MVKLSDAASKRITELLNKRSRGHGIKIGIKTTGCSGLAYTLEYVDFPDQHDNEYVSNNIIVYINPKHEVYLNGLVMDYITQGLNQGFEFYNPNEKARCGCGESFSI